MCDFTVENFTVEVQILSSNNFKANFELNLSELLERKRVTICHSNRFE